MKPTLQLQFETYDELQRFVIQHCPETCERLATAPAAKTEPKPEPKAEPADDLDREALAKRAKALGEGMAATLVKHIVELGAKNITGMTKEQAEQFDKIVAQYEKDEVPF